MQGLKLILFDLAQQRMLHDKNHIPRKDLFNRDDPGLTKDITLPVATAPTHHRHAAQTQYKSLVSFYQFL